MMCLLFEFFLSTDIDNIIMQLEPLSKNCDKDDCAGQVTLVSQCDGLTRVMTESQRHILTDRKYVV